MARLAKTGLILRILAMFATSSPCESVIVLGAGPEADDGRTDPRLGRHPRPSARSRRFPAQQTVRRRDQRACPAEISLPGPRASAHRHPRHLAAVSRRARRPVHGDRIGQPRRADDSPRRVRRAPRVPRRGRGRRESPTRTSSRRARMPTCDADDARRASVQRADGHRRRRREQHDRAPAEPAITKLAQSCGIPCAFSATCSQIAAELSG